MKSITTTIKADSSFRNLQFTSLTLVENGLILKNKEEDEAPISFSELDKIYIKRCQFSLVVKLGFALLSLLLTLILARYLPIEMLLFGESILFIPLFVWMNNYKWYQLIVLLTDEKFYVKTFYVKTKYEHINLVNAVKKEIYDYRIKYNFQFEKQTLGGLDVPDHSFSNMSIA